MIFRTMVLNRINLEEQHCCLAQYVSTEPRHSSHVNCGAGYVIVHIGTSKQQLLALGVLHVFLLFYFVLV